MALKAVVFDVGETLVDEERWWRRLADREGLQPHVVRAAPRRYQPRRPQTRPRVLRESRRAHGLSDARGAYVGDRVDNDVLPAAAAGLVAVHVRHGPWGRLQATPPGAILGLDDLASLPDALASLR